MFSCFLREPCFKLSKVLGCDPGFSIVPNGWRKLGILAVSQFRPQPSTATRRFFPWTSLLYREHRFS